MISIYLKDREGIINKYVYILYLEPSTFCVHFNLSEDKDVDSRLFCLFEALSEQTKEKFLCGELCLRYDLVEQTLQIINE